MIGWESLQFHPLADLFPMLSEEELSTLCDRIEAEGYDPRHPITLHEGKILDGRNRWAACDALRREGRLKSPPSFEQFAGDSPLLFVLRENLHRRHLTASQKAALGVEILPRLEEEARQRQLATLKRGDERPVSPKLDERRSGRSDSKAAEIVGVGRQYVSDAKKIKVAAPALFERIRSGETDLQAARKELKRQSRPASKPAPRLPEGQFSLVYADPPWKYDHSADSADDIENQYGTLTTEEICHLVVHGEPVQAKFGEHCLLLLWTTSPKLEDALQVIRSWGFTYRTCAVWDKERIIQGYYFRQQHELLLVARRGEPGTPRPEDRPASVFRFPRGRHSEKPDEVRDLIERMYPNHRKLELFCREARQGWHSWGNEVAE